MIHYVYATRGGYLYMVGRYDHKPALKKPGEFVVSVADKTPQLSIDSLAHKRFVDHLRRPRKVLHDRHRAGSEKEPVAV